MSEQKRYLESPLLPLRTARLRVRVMRTTDAAAHTEYRNDPAVAKHQLWDLPYPIEDALDKLAGPQAFERLVVGGWTTLAIILPTARIDLGESEVIGDLVTNIDSTGLTAEIGYTLARQHQGRGYAREAAAALTAALFEEAGMIRLHAELDPANTASARVLESIGLVHEADTKKSFWWRGEWTDNTSYAITAEEYRAWRQRPTAPPARVDLVPLTNANYRQYAALRTHRTQERFVAPVQQSLADAMFPDIVDGVAVVPWLRGIEADGEPAGFVMLAEATSADPHPFLWRLLVDRRHQRRGIGARVIEKLVESLRAQGHSALMVSWVEGRGGPRRFYEQLGFVPTGRIIDGETEARLDLS